MGETWATASAVLVGPLFLAPLVAADGGYFPTAWGWGALAFSWIAALVLLLTDETRLSRLEVVVLAALAGLLGWILLSSVWTSTVTRTVLDAERVLVYVTGLGLVLLLVRRERYAVLLGGIWAAVFLVSAYALATRLFPDRLGVVDPIAGYRLSEPIGYWNALGLLAGMGALLALGLAARGRLLVVRAVAAASSPILFATVYFTFSRGAWVALALGALGALVLDPRRLQLVTSMLVVVPWSVLGIWIASRSEPLTQEGFSTAAAAHDGRRLAVVLAALALASAAASIVFSLVERRVRPPRSVRLAYAATIALVVLAGLTGAFTRYGDPISLAQDGYDNFTGPGLHEREGLNARLFNLSGGDRNLMWEVAWNQYRDHPWVGSGSGTFEEHWLRERTIFKYARDAFGVFLETLAELGPVGLGFLLAGLLPPLLAAVRMRRLPLVPAAAGAYLAFIAHAGGDFDWELAGVSLTALCIGAGLLIAARAERSSLAVTGRLRAAAVVLAVTLGAFALVITIASGALAEARDAAAAEDLATVADETRRARRLAPWSSEPWQVLGEAQLRAGHLAAARFSLHEALERDERNWLLWYDLALASSGSERARAIARAAELNPLSERVQELRTGRSGS